MDDVLSLFLDRELSKGKSTVVIPMTDLFYEILKLEPEEEGYPLPSKFPRGIPATLMSTKKRIEIINRLQILIEKRNLRLAIDGNRLVVSPARNATDNDVSNKSGFEVYSKDEIMSWSVPQVYEESQSDSGTTAFSGS